MTKISSDFQDGDVFLFTYDEGAESSKSMVDVIQKLDSVAIRFICEECAITPDALYAMDEDTVYDVVYETMCDIECAETPSSNEPLTWHCAMAADLVTILGNTIDVDEESASDDCAHTRKEGGNGNVGSNHWRHRRLCL